MSEDKTLGRVAFEAYCAAVGGETFDGKPIPGWDELHGDRLKVQGGWEAAAEAIRQHMRMIHALDATAVQENMRLMSAPGRWRPVDVPRTSGPGVLHGDGTGTPLPPVQPGAVQRSKAVEVEAEVDDEPEYDSHLGCPEWCTIDHDGRMLDD